MKWIHPPEDDEVFDVFREVGREEYSRTPAHRRVSRAVELAKDAARSKAGTEEEGLATGYLEVLAEVLRKLPEETLLSLGASFTRPKPKDRYELGIDFGGGRFFKIGGLDRW